MWPVVDAAISFVLGEVASGPSDRTMTIGQLRTAARTARTETDAGAAARATAYEVEIHKKLAVSVACVILALAGAALALRFPWRWLVLGGGCLIFFGYYVALLAGEALADQQVVPAFVGMWMANAVLLALALPVVVGAGGSDPAEGEDLVEVSST